MTPTLMNRAADTLGPAIRVPASDRDLAALATRLAHQRQHQGLPHAEWFPCLQLAAYAFAASNQVWFATTLGVITQSYDDIRDQLVVPDFPPARTDQHALGILLGWFDDDLAVPSEQRLSDVADGFDTLLADDHYAILVRAIQTKRWPSAINTLHALAEFAEDPTGSWDAETLPGYEPAPTAIVAYARDHGLPLDSLNALARTVYWPAFNE